MIRHLTARDWCGIILAAPMVVIVLISACILTLSIGMMVGLRQLSFPEMKKEMQERWFRIFSE